MRVRTDARRTAILQAAWEAFRQHGFERTTMSDISCRAGGSKATLYGYFKSKQDLFLAAFEEKLADRAEALFGILGEEGGLRDRLAAFALAYLKLRLDPELIAMDRILIAESERMAVADKFYSDFVEPHWARLARVFEAAITAGDLRPADSFRAALHLKGLIETDLLERRWHGDRTRIGEAELRQAVESALDVFFGGYAARKA